jgi:GT2 family glycosyltransferase
MNKLTIVLGTYNRLEKLKSCMGSIIGKVETEYELIVIDAGSDDGTAEYLKTLRNNIHLIFQKKRIGQVKSLNKYLPKIRSNYVCWISDDNVVDAKTLDTAVDILDKEKKVGMVGLKVKDMTGRFKDEFYIGGIWPSGVLNMNQGVIRADLFKKLNYFDTKFPDYGIDADLTTKVLMEGYQVVLTKNIGIYHYRDYDNSERDFEKSYRHINLQKALQIYRRKYKKKFKIKQNDNSLFLFLSSVLSGIIRIVYFTIIGVGEDSLIGNSINIRDWDNLLKTRFINLFDFWYNRHNSYYLVQDIRNTKITNYAKNAE